MSNGARTGGEVMPGVSGFMLGLLVGSVVAGIAALLYAPRSGQETRERLKDEVNETQQMFQTWMNDLKQRTDSISQIFRTEIKYPAQTTGDGHKNHEE